jgi:hypothetical protein
MDDFEDASGNFSGTICQCIFVWKYVGFDSLITTWKTLDTEDFFKI